MKLLHKDGSQKIDEPRSGKRDQKKRFVIVKLEERIAPACHYNPHGKQVGCGHHHHSCYCFCY